MAERASWAVGNGLINREDARFAVGAGFTPNTSAVKSRTGFRPGPGNPGAVTASGTPDGNVTVAAFQAVLSSTRGAQAPYVVTLDSPKVINVLSTPASPTNGRNDLIIAQQSDSFYSDASSAFEVKQVVGTPSGSPVDPTPSGSPDYILLARVRVSAGATSITSGMIDDLRPSPRWTVALGGIVPVESATERNAYQTYDGQVTYRRDTNELHVYDGSVWRVVSAPVVVTNASDLATAVGWPYNGQLAFVTSAQRIYRYDGSSWVDTAAKPVASLRRTTTQSLPDNTATAIQFTVEDEDSHNGHSNTTNPSRWTCPVGWGGLYRLSGGASFATGTGRRWVSFYKNGIVIPGSRTNMNATTSQLTSTDPRSPLVRLVPGDYVELMAVQESGAALNTVAGADDQPTMYIEWVAP